MRTHDERRQVMYCNEWTVVTSEIGRQSNVLLIPQETYRQFLGHDEAPPVKHPVMVVGVAEVPVIIIPRQATQRKTQKAFRDAAKLALQLEPQHIGVVLDTLDGSMRAAALWGISQGLYHYQDLNKETFGPEVRLVGMKPEPHDAMLIATAKSQSLVRDWVNLPSNIKSPEYLATLIQSGSSENIRWQLFDYGQLQAMGAGGIVGVGQGSHRSPVMVVGHYEGSPGQPWLALVGKGITFDSGGISLKPGEGMGRMKGDMGGAAAVMAALRTVADLEIEVNVMAVAPLAENLPGGGAYRPGDVLTMMDGTTVEVISTDAEGRLVLADGVTWAIQQNVAAVVDIATLTGANVVALGGIRSGLLSTDVPLRNMVVAAAEAAAEPAWELPHDEDYLDFIQTSTAVIKNSGGRPAGTITAGLFVGHFAKNTPWAHLDIAGLAFESGTGIGAGATGYGVATLVELCRKFGGAPHDAPKNN